MRVLAIDASTRSSGFAIGTNAVLEQYGCIPASSKQSIQRIIKMRESIKTIIETYKVDKIVMEQVRPEYNSHTMKVLMWLQAAVVIASFEINPKIKCQFMGASTWRSLIKIHQGRGIKRNNLKNQDIEYVKNKYNFTVNDDQADAICLFDAYWISLNNEINWE